MKFWKIEAVEPDFGRTQFSLWEKLVSFESKASYAKNSESGSVNPRSLHHAHLGIAEARTINLLRGFGIY